MKLNELAEGQNTTVPCTDSRLRPDIRLLENGDIGEYYKYQAQLFCKFILIPVKWFIATWSTPIWSTTDSMPKTRISPTLN